MAQNQSKNLISIRFNLHKLRFTPYKDAVGNHNTKSIVKSIFSYLNTELIAGRGHLIDKNKGRKNEEPRPLFMSLAVTDLKKHRIRGTLALLRSGRVPFLKPADKFILVPLGEEGDIAEQTHFFIDYSKGDSCVICIEFNNNGPRLSDLEYYLRNVGSDTLELARATTIETFMSSSLDEAIANFSNILNIEIKAQPKKLDQIDTDMKGYFSGMQSFARQVHPKFLKVEASFQLQGRALGQKDENKEANQMVKNLLNRFKIKPENIDSFDNFVIKYEDKAGNEELFSLLKGKVEFLKEIDLKDLKTPRDWYDLIETDFDEFMETL